MQQPRVSILIPNFNNGVASSRTGEIDFINNLLVSLEKTLENDPTPVEIIAVDDGSSDDSLDTLRRWATRTRPDGSPFLTLHEREHCGVLSIVANELVQLSQGEILVRLDGDIEVITPNWAQILCETFDRFGSRVGVIGPKQLLNAEMMHSLGDWVLHPKGYHHIAQGLRREIVTRPIECDHVMGCFYCCRRSVYDEVGGFDESILRGQTVDFGLTARLKGHACIATPRIEFYHRHKEREDRSTRADTAEGVDFSRQRFFEKWGFDRIAPDLDVVLERYAGTPLVWNANVFAESFDRNFVCHPLDPPPESLETSAWLTLDRNPAAQQHHETRIRAATQMLAQFGRPGDSVVVLGCGSGLVCHALAMAGYQVVGVDAIARHIELATQVTEGRAYPGPTPRFIRQSDPYELDLPKGETDAVLIFDQIEHHPNPVRLLNQAKALLNPEGAIAVLMPRPTRSFLDPSEPQRLYHRHEIIGQLKAALNMEINGDVGPADSPLPQLLVATPFQVEAKAMAA